LSACVHAALEWAQPGDLVMTIGAGSVYRIGPEILDKLKPSLVTV
jgi:UDP-N-acetylmuramate-alanine ligase